MLPKFRHNGIMYNGIEMLYMYEHKRSQRAVTHPKNDLYQGIENAVLVRNFQKEQKRILNTI